jgi:hypothetical protein
MYGVHTSDHIYSGAGVISASGSSLIALNGGAEPLQAGDTVAAAGLAVAFEASATPLLQVSRLSGGPSGYIIGVVEKAIRIDFVDKPDATYRAVEGPAVEGGRTRTWVVASETSEQVAIQSAVDGPARQGDYLVIRTHGLARVRVDATAAPIAAGMPLAVDRSGVARSAAAVPSSAGVPPMLLGQALESLADGPGLIWVLVNPR